VPILIHFLLDISIIKSHYKVQLKLIICGDINIDCRTDNERGMRYHNG
jgi:hypothetical protein